MSIKERVKTALAHLRAKRVSGNVAKLAEKIIKARMRGQATGVLVGAAVAFGIAIFMILVGLAATGAFPGIDNTTKSSISGAGVRFLSTFGGIVTISLLIYIVLDKLGVGEIIKRSLGE
jgi:hypothetical protein